MVAKKFLSLTDQVVETLRQGMLEGRWRTVLPGRDRLAEELGCSHWTVEESLRRLTKEGWLVSQGAGRPRKIKLLKGGADRPGLQVKILLYEPSDRSTDYLVDLVYQIQQVGHQASFADKTMKDLGMKPERIARFVQTVEADAWVVVAGPREVLEWFSQQDFPAFALFGRVKSVPIPGAWLQKEGALLELVDRLIDLGHQRIVMLVREDLRKPGPGFHERLFLERLVEHGVKAGSFNLPDWGDNPKELRRMLDTLFKHTPPTALIVGEPMLYFAVMQHLAALGLSAPKDVSLACEDSSTSFDWCGPVITRISWEPKYLTKRVVEWVNNISRGKNDRRKRGYPTRLIAGDTIGPVPQSDSPKATFTSS